MKTKIVLAICALALPLSLATVAAAHKKPHNHHHHHAGKGCKGEFHYYKAGKCLDSRKKA